MLLNTHNQFQAAIAKPFRNPLNRFSMPDQRTFDPRTGVRIVPSDPRRSVSGMNWEIRYVDLDRGSQLNLNMAREALKDAQAQIAELGADGWDPVGEVIFSYTFQQAPYTERKLMFKRQTA